MGSQQEYALVLVPREGVNDDTVRVLEWLVEDGAPVEVGAALVVLETAKSSFQVDAPRAGFVFRVEQAGAEISVGKPLAIIAELAQRPILEETTPVATARDSHTEQVVTTKAKALIEKNDLPMEQFAKLSVVRESDVEAVLQQQSHILVPPPPRA